MPRANGRPSTRVFMKLGKVTVERPDSLNWVVSTGEGMRYYTNLPGAVKAAVAAAAETRASDAQAWLAEYRRITATLETKLAKALVSWTEDGV